MEEKIVNEMINNYIQNLHNEEISHRKILIEKILDPETIPKEVHLIKVTCIRCGHSWFIRRNRFPKVCASCTSRYWNSLTNWELGYEYFGKRVYAYCKQCGQRAVKNGTKHRKNGDVMISFFCQNCNLQSRINFTTNESEIKLSVKTRGRPKFISNEIQKKIINRKGGHSTYNIMLIEILPYNAELDAIKVYPKYGD